MAKQREDTYQIFGDISSKHLIPELGIVDFQMVPAYSEAQWEGFEAAITSKGFKSVRYEDGSTLEISTRPLSLSAEVIWEHEETLTRMANEFGFKPDGWGFYGVDSSGN